MRDTLLANVGCLAVFQVAGNDARTLVWELGKERVTEDDITSLPVHHCYVRATVSWARWWTQVMISPLLKSKQTPYIVLALHM